MVKVYSRDQLLSLRITTELPGDEDRMLINTIQPRRGCRAGRHVQARRRRPKPIPVSSLAGNKIPVVISYQKRRPATITVNKASKTRRHLRPVQRSTTRTQRHDAVERVPSLYVINAAALCKSHALEHLSADLTSYCIDVAVVTETQFKAKHADSAVVYLTTHCCVATEQDGKAAASHFTLDRNKYSLHGQVLPMMVLLNYSGHV